MKIPTNPSSPSSMSTAPISRADIKISVGIRLGRTCLVIIRGVRWPTEIADSIKVFGRMAITALRTNCITSPQPTNANAMINGVNPWRIPMAKISVIAKSSAGKAEMTSPRPRITRSINLSAFHPAIAPSKKPTPSLITTTTITSRRVCKAPVKIRLMMSRPRTSVPQGYSTPGSNGGMTSSPSTMVKPEVV